MKIFSIIIGVITLISFVIQVTDALPEFKGTIEKISYILLGTLVGLIISFFDKNKIRTRKLSTNQLFAYLFYGFIGLAIVIILIAIVLIEDTEKITLLKTVLGSIGTFTFISFFFVFKIFTSGTNLNVDERIALGEKYFSEHNYSRSLHFYYDLLDSLDEFDSRRPYVSKRIHQIEKAQVTIKDNLLK